MRRGHLARQRLVEPVAAVIEAGDRQLDTVAVVMGLDRVQGGDRRGVPQMGAGEVDDDLGGIVGVAERFDQLLVGGEEHLAGDRVDAGRSVGVDDAIDFDQMRDPAGEDRLRHPQQPQLHLDRPGEDRRRQQVLDAVLFDQGDDDESHRAGRR